MDGPRLDPAALASGSTLTARQVEVLSLRARDHTQREIAEAFGTTASNVSRIESAAERNVEKAQRTLEVARLVRAPARVRAEPGTGFGELVDRVYAKGDEADITIAYSRPELHSRLYERFRGIAENNALTDPVEIGITPSGEIEANGLGGAP